MIRKQTLTGGGAVAVLVLSIMGFLGLPKSVTPPAENGMDHQDLSIKVPASPASDPLSDPDPGHPPGPAATIPLRDGVTEAGQTFTLVSGTGQFVEWNGRSPASRKTEIVVLNKELLTDPPVVQVGDFLEMTLHNGPLLRAEIVELILRGNGTVAVTGHLASSTHGRVYLSYTKQIASILIQDPANSTTFKIEYDSSLAAYIALEVDYASSDILGCLASSLGNPVPDDAASNAAVPAQAETLVGVSASLPDVVTLDVLALYTPGALANEGSEADVLNNISIAFQLAADTHQNSDTRVTLNLVHTDAVAYTEEDPETSDSPEIYLDDLTDGLISGVPLLREIHEADFVVLFLKTEETGGLAWRADSYDSPEYAYSIVRIQQTDFTYTMVHEVAHNMGIGHSATQTVQPGPGSIYPYAAGWQWADAASPASIGYCTVMTYEDFDNISGIEYERVGHFSNPEILHNGNPTGDAASGNSALVIRNGRFDYSGYRGAKAIPVSAHSLFPEDLGFEDYLGIWYQPDTEELDWRRREGVTPSFNTGPDAAYQGSYYLYLEASGPNPGDEAVLSTLLDFGGYNSALIDFAYHMYGSSMGSLFLEASDDGGFSWSGLWSRSGDQGDVWHTESVDLSPYDGQVLQLRFRAVRGDNYDSDIALDEITIAASMPPPDYATWVAANYPGLSDPSLSGDPDFDGVGNFVEYTMGMEPDVPDVSNGVSSLHDTAAGSIEMSFTRARATVQYTVESSSILEDWALAGEEWNSSLSPPDLVPVGEVQTVEVPLPAEGALFLRLNVSE